MDIFDYIMFKYVYQYKTKKGNWKEYETINKYLWFYILEHINNIYLYSIYKNLINKIIENKDIKFCEFDQNKLI